MSIAGLDYRRIGLENLGRPLPIAMLVYSLGFVGAGLILWRGEFDIPNARWPEPLSIAQMAASDAGQPPVRAGDP